MKNYTLTSITIKTAIVHTVTYFLVGFVAFSLFDYAGRYAEPVVANLMRQTSEPIVAGGPLFQVLRGVLFGLVFFLMRDIVFARRNGWLILWVILVVLGVLSTFGPSPSSIEGMIYTVLPLSFHIVGLPEVVLQAFLLSFLTYYWVNHREKRWLNWAFGVAFTLVLVFSTLGILAGLGILQVPA